MAPFWVFASFVCVYALFWESYELLILALCIDALFGDAQIGVFYTYTLFVASVLVIFFFLKPYIRFYRT
jgi:hypothetical protein